MADSDFAGNFYENLRSLISLVDNLRDAGLSKYIKLPRIAVLGTQSSGKSSVLESVVGLNFLPRGDGLCTRRPLEMRLVHTFDKSDPWAKFDGIDQKFTNFTEVRQTIERLTEDVAGRNKGIVDDPIILTIYSSTCPDLTMIDLPGITRIPLAGSDQPADIERITKEMAYRYASDPRTIILCVIPANQDISTSEAIQMAKKVDPSGIRTLGVITKIDIMDRGTNARKLLMGEEVPLKLGYIGVRNRNQQDILDNKSVSDALREEKEYFDNHEVYSKLPPGHTSTETLAKKLTQILFTHIKHFLPDILREIVFKLKECEERMRDLGPSAPVDPKSKTQLLWNMITDYCEIYKNTIRGKYDRRRSTRMTKDLEGGGVIKGHFSDLLSEYTGRYSACEAYTDEDIERAIQLHEGDTIPGFPSADVFIYLIQPALEKMKEPVLECVSEIYSFLEQLSNKIIERVFYRFPSLIPEISEVATNVIASECENCKVVVENIIDCEEGYLFTNDMDYLTERTSLIPQDNTPGTGPVAPRDPRKLFVNEIRLRIDTYFRLVIRNVRDTIPKAIGYFLVRGSMDRMQYELYKAVSAEGVLNLVSEPSSIANERELVKNTLETLKSAQKILKRDPQLAAQSDNVENEIRQQEEEQRRAEEKKEKEAADKVRKAEEAKEKAIRDKQRAEEEKKAPAAAAKEEAAPPKPAATKPAVKSLFGDVKQDIEDAKAAGRIANKAAPLVKKLGSDKPLF